VEDQAKICLYDHDRISYKTLRRKWKYILKLLNNIFINKYYSYLIIYEIGYDQVFVFCMFGSIRNTINICNTQRHIISRYGAPKCFAYIIEN
jgi:hypothetical protein